MYAIIRALGHQYKVAPGDVIELPVVQAAGVGDRIRFTEVLAARNGTTLVVGKPLVPSASVQTEVLSHDKLKKIITFKKKRRNGFHKERGHRTQVTRVKILSIEGV